MKIALIAKPGHSDSGVGRYVSELTKWLQSLGHEVELAYPITPVPKWLSENIRRWLGWDLKAYFETYPLWIDYPKADIYHFSSQNLATLMLFHPPKGKTIITIHDFIPWTTRNDPELRSYQHKLEEFSDMIALMGIGRATKIVADSDYSARSISNFTKIPLSEIPVINLGIN